MLGPIDVDAVFGADLVERAKRYERFFYVDWVLAQIALLVTLWIYAKRGAAFARESSAGPIGTGMLLGMLGLAIAWIVHVPFALAAHWWQRRWDQNDLSYLDWLFQDWAVLAAQFLSICVALLIVMGLARKLGDRWWLPGAGVFVGIAALFSFVAPYLDFTTTPLKDKALLEAAAGYESELGVGHIPLRVEKVSPDTDEANAYAFGLGPSRRVVFWDTILRKPFTKEEQKVVLAHELGHHSQEHLPKGLGWFALFAIPGRVDPHADDQTPGRHGGAGGRAPRSSRRRRLPARDAAAGEPHLEPHGGRGGLEGARGDPRPGGSRGRDGRVRQDVPRRPRPAAPGADRVRGRIRRSPTASRWRAPSRPHR